MGAGIALWLQSVPLQYQQQISNFASLASELEREVSKKVGLLALITGKHEFWGHFLFADRDFSVKVDPI